MPAVCQVQSQVLTPFFWLSSLSSSVRQGLVPSALTSATVGTLATRHVRPALVKNTSFTEDATGAQRGKLRGPDPRYFLFNCLPEFTLYSASSWDRGQWFCEGPNHVATLPPRSHLAPCLPGAQRMCLRGLVTLVTARDIQTCLVPVSPLKRVSKASWCWPPWMRGGNRSGSEFPTPSHVFSFWRYGAQASESYQLEQEKPQKSGRTENKDLFSLLKETTLESTLHTWFS